ncbi:hypothetical protein LOTGIDRAFT_195492 [Lottia gigantea]|uniref:2-(3-amino-3-carboxypropyl)histidine synthase subunit 2 n=1 Tax=Lottia gigantea TaxID=225164 RepID=V3Z5M5_LOTGI|nr:hypothetical protein LOTGIDRAFT_195492 [Lottia gigantea]ESO86068.1 hypothetical protein LOTGIDRAFT_195492 [Lottia gigantea]
MGSTSAFSSTDILDRETNVNPGEITDRTTGADIPEFYEIERCQKFIQDGQFKRIALQFPDELLGDSSCVVKALQPMVDGMVFILGDTSYGSCCVDEVAAQHSNADCIIHFGRSCLSQTVRLPVLHVFGKFPLDVTDCCEKFQTFADVNSHVIILFETSYLHCVRQIHSILLKSHPNVVLSYLNIPENTNPVSEDLSKGDNCENKTTIISRCNRHFVLLENTSLENYSVFYIGCEGQTLSNLIMNFNQNQFFTYDPITKMDEKHETNTNRALMKRYYMIERIKDADIVGIVIGTLGVNNYLDVIHRIKQLLKMAGKKFYTFVVGKLNTAKLGNFLEIDAFVLVSCSENTLVDSKEFYKPIVTPFELEIGLNSNREWSVDYRTDFHEILPGSENYSEIKVLDEEMADVSLITNKVRTLGKRSNSRSNVTDIQIGSDKSVVAHTAAEHLSNRSWQGLEQALGETPVEKAEEGQTGIAMSYTSEPSK